MTTTVIQTATVADWEAAEAHLAEHASADAYALTELTAVHDADLHHIVLDPKTRTIWWAYDNTPLDGEGWTIDQLTPKDAAEMASSQIGIIQDKLDEISTQPEDCGYAQGFGDLDNDQAALDEYAEILRLTLPEDPREARGHIQATRSQIAQQDALWQRTYANMVSDLAGTEHGGKSRAARTLGVTDVQVGRVIREEVQRRTALTEAVREARSELARG
ncbi:hypothetical protein [Streptomyces sp. NPDC004296]|uniref:hypothetical protein n=1 Tax=Streptomyces sp. NPDC004296 TaxID=3364697 RepID=UPI0036900E68